MNTLLSITFLLIIFNLQSSLSELNPGKCDKHELDSQVLKLTGFYGDARYSFPDSDAAFPKFCKTIKSGSKYSIEYASKCLGNQPISKSLLNVYSYTNAQAHKKYCNRRNPKVRKEMISFSKCINKNKDIGIQCTNQFLDRLNITNHAPNKDKFQYICCLGEGLKQCILDKIRPRNDPLCTEKALDNFGDYYDTISRNVFSLLCDDTFIDNIDKCDLLINNILKPFKRGIPRVSWKSPFQIIADAIEAIY